VCKSAAAAIGALKIFHAQLSVDVWLPLPLPPHLALPATHSIHIVIIAVVLLRMLQKLRVDVECPISEPMGAQQFYGFPKKLNLV